jgi:hypothetical protein
VQILALLSASRLQYYMPESLDRIVVHLQAADAILHSCMTMQSCKQFKQYSLRIAQAQHTAQVACSCAIAAHSACSPSAATALARQQPHYSVPSARHRHAALRCCVRPRWSAAAAVAASAAVQEAQSVQPPAHAVRA